MAIAVFPQAVLAPEVHAQVAAVMAGQHAQAFTGGFPNGVRFELGDGWHIGMTYNEGLMPSVVEAFAKLRMPYVTVKALHDKLLTWPVVWHTPHPCADRSETTFLSLHNAVEQGWFEPMVFRHQGACGHLALAAAAAGGVLARARPRPDNQTG
jgi:hypothetical protein